MNKAIIGSGLILLAALLALVPVIGCAPEEVAPPEEKVIKIGITSDLTGSYSTVGVPIFQGQYDYLRYINDAKGGINGIPLKVMWADCRTDPSLVLSTYRRFKDAGIVALIEMSSTELMALKPFIERDKIPTVGTSASYYSFVPPGWYYANYLFEGQTLAAALKWWYENEWSKRGLDRPARVAIMSMNNPLGLGSRDACLAWAKRNLNIEVVSDQTTPVMALDFTTELLTAKAKNPDIMILAYPTNEGLIFRDATRIDWPKDVPFNCEPATSYTHGNILIAGPGAISQSFGATTFYLLTETNIPGMKLLHQIHERYRGGPCADVGYQAAAGSIILEEAIKRALDKVGYDNLTGTAIKEALDTLHNFETGVVGPVSYDDYPGDRLCTECGRVVRFDWDKQGVVVVTDWFDFPPFIEFKEAMEQEAAL